MAVASNRGDYHKQRRETRVDSGLRKVGVMSEDQLPSLVNVVSGVWVGDVVNSKEIRIFLCYLLANVKWLQQSKGNVSDHGGGSYSNAFVQRLGSQSVPDGIPFLPRPISSGPITENRITKMAVEETLTNG